MEVSVVEIYNNDIRDLLSKDPNAKHDVVTGADGSLNFPTVICKYDFALLRLYKRLESHMTQ